MQMEFSEAKAYVQNQLESYLKSRGINTRKAFTCLNPEHQDKHPSMMLMKSKTRVYCFSCKHTFDIFDLIGIDYGLGKEESFRKAFKMYNVELPKKESSPTGYKKQGNQQQKDWRKKCLADISKTDYLANRGISLETVMQFPIGYDESYRGSRGVWKAVVFFKNHDTYEARNTDAGAEHKNRYDKPAGKPDTPFHLSAIHQNRPIFITEGIIDLLSIAEAGSSGLALSGAAIGKVIEPLMQKASRLEYIPPIIGVLDDDETGNRTTEELRATLESMGLTFFDGRGVLIPGQKDCNASLMANRPQFLANVQGMESIAIQQDEARKQEFIARESAAGVLADIRQEIAKTDIFSPTGFKQLDKAMGGGIYTGLHFLGGISAVGKTTFCLQLGDNVAEQGKDVLIFSLEMTRKELVSKSVSRLTKKQGGGIDTRHIMTGSLYADYTQAKLKEIDNAFAEYAETIGGNIFIKDNTTALQASQIREQVERHISLTGNRPLVLIDYLQIIAPEGQGLSERQATDKNVEALKQISRDFDIPVICISSFNRDNYTAPVNMASFKESGGVEYSSDVLLGIQYAGMDYEAGEKDTERQRRVREIHNTARENRKAGRPIQVELKILKQRFAPPSSVSFDFWGKYNLYEESMGDYEPGLVVPNHGLIQQGIKRL